MSKDILAEYIPILYVANYTVLIILSIMQLKLFVNISQWAREKRQERKQSQVATRTSPAEKQLLFDHYVNSSSSIVLY